MKTNENPYDGFLSAKSKKDITKRLDKWLNSLIAESSQTEVSPETVYTSVLLALPSKQFHSDEIITQKCLKPFLEWFKAEYKDVFFVWASTVAIKGNVFYSFTCLCECDVVLMLRKWQELTLMLGYQDFPSFIDLDNLSTSC